MSGQLESRSDLEMSKCFNPTCGYSNLPQILLTVVLKCYQSGLSPMKIYFYLLFTLTKDLY